jgi:hypothetical protein
MGQLFTHRKSFDSNQKSSGIRNVIFNRMGQSGGIQSSKRRSSSARDCLLGAEMNHDSGSGSGSGSGGGGSGSYKHSRRADVLIANGKTDRPKNSLELEREWKKCHADKSPLQALRYLLMAQGDELHTILCNNDFEQQDESLMSPPCVQNVPLNFRQTPEYIATLYKVEMDSTMMEQIIKAISLFLTCNTSNHPMMTTTRLNFMYRTMYSITTCGRFSLHINFMNDQHQNNVRCILDRLLLEYKNERHGIRTDSEVLVYNGKDIEILYELYHVAPVDACK